MKFRKLGRTWWHRNAMLKTMVGQLIQHERIETTVSRAKELRRVADRVVGYSKNDTLHHRRLARKWVRSEDNVYKLFHVLGPRYLERPGGYTRILRTRQRKGDNAALAMIEFVDREGEMRPANAPWRKDLDNSNDGGRGVTILPPQDGGEVVNS